MDCFNLSIFSPPLRSLYPHGVRWGGLFEGSKVFAIGVFSSMLVHFARCLYELTICLTIFRFFFLNRNGGLCCLFPSLFDCSYFCFPLFFYPPDLLPRITSHFFASLFPTPPPIFTLSNTKVAHRSRTLEPPRYMVVLFFTALLNFTVFSLASTSLITPLHRVYSRSSFLCSAVKVSGQLSFLPSSFPPQSSFQQCVHSPQTPFPRRFFRACCSLVGISR